MILIYMYIVYQPAEDMYWYVHIVDKTNELVRSVCDISPQQGVKDHTQGIHDYFLDGDYTTEIPKGTFDAPKGCQ